MRGRVTITIIKYTSIRFRAYIDLKRNNEDVKSDNRVLLGVVGELSNCQSNDLDTPTAASLYVRQGNGCIASARGRLRQTPEMIVASLSYNSQNKAAAGK